MLVYNTQRKKLALPEYGRKIQKMVDHCLTIEDRDERTACAYTIVNTMKIVAPSQGNQEEYRRKLWDHLAIMSDFKLDIDWPYEVIQAGELATEPQPIPLPDINTEYRQYGNILVSMIRHAAEMEPSEEKDALLVLLANQMKKAMLAVNPDGVDDAKVFKDLRQITRGAVDLDPEVVKLHEFKAVPAPSKKKKKK